MTTRKGLPLLLAMAVQLLGLGTAAEAGSAFMNTAGRTTQPIGHYDFCQREAAECRQKTPKQAPIELSKKLWSQIVSVNNEVNARISPRTDFEMWGTEELWSYPDIVGDCEDYALEKRRNLMKLGVPAGSLLMTVVRQPNGDGHAVLTLRTNRGDFVLDNLEPRVLPWVETEYTFLKRQSERNSGVWVAIDDSRQTVLVGSVK